MTDFDLKIYPRTTTEILQKVRAEQKSVYALEHMLGYHISELEELRPHQKTIEFIAEFEIFVYFPKPGSPKNFLMPCSMLSK